MSMLDDFVEHSSGPSGGGRYDASRPKSAAVPDISHVEYEGYEQDDLVSDQEEHDVVTALETGFVPSTKLQTGLPPLFALSLVQYSPPSSILQLVTANNILFLASHPLSIIIIDLNKPDDLITVDLPRPAPEKGQPQSQKETPVIQRLFADPTARHLIITTNTGDTFYLPISPGNPAVQSRRPRPLRLRQTIQAVGWSPISGAGAAGDGSSGGAEGGTSSKGDAVTPPSTDVLLGTTSGQILSLPLPPQDDIFKSVAIGTSKAVEKDLQHVYTLPDAQPVTGVAFGFWPRESSGKGKRDKRAWVVITTKARVYEVQGNVTSTTAGGKNGGWAEEVFKPFRDGAPKFQELPGDLQNSELRLFMPTTQGQIPSALPAPTSLAWLTAPGLYTSSLSASPTSDILSKPSLLPYPSLDDAAPTPAFSRAPAASPLPVPVPLSIAITQWHWLLLYPERLVAIARENEKIVWEESLPLSSNEHALGLSADPVSRTYWVYTSRSILEVLVKNEDRDVWRAKLEKGEYTSALGFVKSAPQRDIVLSKQGDALFEQGRFIQAAQCYAKSSRSFEYVCLRFVDVDERDALRIYLSDRLDLLDKRDRTQRMMLATWLIEIYLSKCNTLEDILAAESTTSDVESLTIERQMMEEDMRNFMTTYQHDLEPKVVYELIQSHGRTDLYLFYANLNRDHGKVVEHWVTEEEWLKAIDVLNHQTTLDLYYRFASVLMRHAPKETVDSWIRQSSLSPKRLIPALLQHPKSRTSEAIRYLNHVIKNHNSTDVTIYNLLLTFHVTTNTTEADSGALLKFLAECPDDPITERPYYDLDYALRLCKANGKTQACVLIYSKMGLYENSVDLALEKGDLELAKVNADRPEDDDLLRKKLWLKIAKYVVQEKQDIKSAIKFLEATDLVKIEDILPFFPDFVVIDDFKTEICSALEDYATKIESLRGEMDEATQSAESIKKDIENLRSRFVTVDKSDKCWKCGLALVSPSKSFYVFPCQHAFHADCLITMATEFLPPASLRRILHLQEDLVNKSDPSSRALLSASFPTQGSGTNTPARDKQGTSGSTATDLLLGVTGRNKLLAAGDKLRELIIPDVLAQAVTVVGQGVGVGSSTTSTTAKSKKNKRDTVSDEKAAKAKAELDKLVAAVCPLCEGSVVSLDKPFVAEGEGLDWDV